MENKTAKAPSAFFERLKEGLLEGIAHLEGKIELKTTFLTIPDPPPAYDARTRPNPADESWLQSAPLFPVAERFTENSTKLGAGNAHP